MSQWMKSAACPGCTRVDVEFHKVDLLAQHDPQLLVYFAVEGVGYDAQQVILVARNKLKLLEK